VKVSDTDWMWKLNQEIFPGDVQQMDAKLGYELMLVQHWFLLYTAFATHFKSLGSKIFSFIVCSSLLITFDGLAEKSSTAFLFAFTRRTSFQLHRNVQLIRLLYVKMEVTVIKTNKGHKSILCEGFRYRLDVETKSGDLSWRPLAKMTIYSKNPRTHCMNLYIVSDFLNISIFFLYLFMTFYILNMIYFNFISENIINEIRSMYYNAMLRKTPTLKIARASPRNSVFIGHASNPP
jgi:hypothetical protein